MVTHGKYVEDDKWCFVNVFQQCGWSSCILGACLYIQAPGIVQPEEGKVILGADVSFPKGDGKIFALTQCWSSSGFNASAHLRMYWEDLGGSSLENHCAF